MILPICERIIAIGDLHGDFKITIKTLQKANLIDNKKNWIGNKTILIQLGDQIDRGGREENYKDEDSEMKIYNLFNKLHKQAQIQGGGVYSLLGNHELMNILGNLDYASEKGINHFGGEEGRIKAFQIGGRLAKNMAKNRYSIIQVGGYIFVHGGITPNVAAKYSIDDINKYMNQYLNGDKSLEKNKDFREIFFNNNGIFWNRSYSRDSPDCSKLYNVLDIYKAKGIVVGHTPQDKINCKCKKKIWRIDVAMSNAFGKNDKVQVLEILNDGEKINIL